MVCRKPAAVGQGLGAVETKRCRDRSAHWQVTAAQNWRELCPPITHVYLLTY